MQRSLPLVLLTLVIGIHQRVLCESGQHVAQQPAQLNPRVPPRVVGGTVPSSIHSSSNPIPRPNPNPSSRSNSNSSSSLSSSSSSSSCSNANANNGAQIHSLTERFRCIQCDSECDPHCETLQQVDVYPFAKIDVPTIPCSTFCVKLMSNRNRSQENQWVMRTCLSELKLSMRQVFPVCLSERHPQNPNVQGTFCFCESDLCNAGTATAIAPIQIHIHNPLSTLLPLLQLLVLSLAALIISFERK